MGNLSEHFNLKNFVCRCGKCGEKYKISLTLTGILETIFFKFNKPVKIIEAFRCADHPRLMESVKMDPHAHGKAVDIGIDGLPLEDLFNFVRTIPEISAIGFNPDNNFVHLEVGGNNRKLWLGEGLSRRELTPEAASAYHLNLDPPPDREKQIVKIKLIDNDI